MTDTALDYELIVAPVANEYARKFGRWGVEREDVAQELRIWILQHPRKLAEWAEMGDSDETKMVARSLRNEANRYAQEIKAQFLGYSPNDLTFYSRGELKVLLDAMFDPGAWTEPPVSDTQGRSQRAPAEGGNWAAMLADVSTHFDKLTAGDRTLLRAFHEDQMTNVMLAELHDVTPQTMSVRHIKALNRLLALMGGERPGQTHDDGPEGCECEYVGTRKVMSNAAARAYQENVYEETA